MPKSSFGNMYKNRKSRNSVKPNNELKFQKSIQKKTIELNVNGEVVVLSNPDYVDFLEKKLDTVHSDLQMYKNKFIQYEKMLRSMSKEITNLKRSLYGG